MKKTQLITQSQWEATTTGATPETGVSWNTIHEFLARPEMAGYRLPTVDEVLAIPAREWPEWTTGKTYFGQHWAHSSLSVYVAKVVYPDGRVETHRTDQSNGGIAFRFVVDCGDPRCENGTIVGDEYVTRDGDVDHCTWDCSTCNPAPSVYTWDEFTEVPF